MPRTNLRTVPRLWLDPETGATVYHPNHPPLVAEYGSLNPEDMARRTVLASAPHKRGFGNVELVRSTEGYECAGSAARWTDPYYAVRFRLDGAEHGQRYAPHGDGLAQAKDHFERITR